MGTTAKQTIVVQSFREHDIPEWISRCLSTVQAWADRSHFVYDFAGDAFLQLAPAWYRAKADPHITVITDLARLLLARQYLQQGFDRVIWIDADVLIFAPSLLHIDPDLSCAFCREVWMHRNYGGLLHASFKINNSACMFRNDCYGVQYLEDYISACVSIVARLPCILDHTEVGTKFLTARNRHSPLPVMSGFGTLSPVMLYALLQSDAEVLKSFMDYQTGPLYAVNLCNFFRSTHTSRPYRRSSQVLTS